MIEQPPIPAQRDDIAAEFLRCVNSRAIMQHEVMDRLLRIDAVTRRLEDLLDAATATP
jgi:hypothetical protein